MRRSLVSKNARRADSSNFFFLDIIAGSTYHGRASDTWAVGVTLYCMISGHYPFLGDTMQEINDKVQVTAHPFPFCCHPVA